MKYHHVVKINTLNPLAKNETFKAVSKTLFGGFGRRGAWQAVERSVGYWMLWSQLQGGRAEIIDKGYLPRRTAFEREAEFKAVFGMGLDEWNPSMLTEFMQGHTQDTGAPAEASE